MCVLIRELALLEANVHKCHPHHVVDELESHDTAIAALRLLWRCRLVVPLVVRGCVNGCICIALARTLWLQRICPDQEVPGEGRTELHAAGWEIQNPRIEGVDQPPCFFSHLIGNIQMLELSKKLRDRGVLVWLRRVCNPSGTYFFWRLNNSFAFGIGQFHSTSSEWFLGSRSDSLSF